MAYLVGGVLLFFFCVDWTFTVCHYSITHSHSCCYYDVKNITRLIKVMSSLWHHTACFRSVMVNVFSTVVIQVEGLLLQTTRGYEIQSVQLQW